jgi:hypothetical protein
MGFEIGSQNAVSIQNVDGDLTIGEQHIEASWSAAESVGSSRPSKTR